MGQRVTIKDIAEIAKVSIGTVHCALTGKPGVGEEMRRNIQEIAKRQGYRANSVASSLKRKTIKIAAAFPGSTDENRFYYSYAWEGFRDYLETVSDFNIESIEVPFYGDSNQTEELSSLLQRVEVDGLLTLGYVDVHGRVSIQPYVEQKIPVVLFANDIPLSGRMCCVLPNFHMTGRMLAELLMRQIHGDGDILFCAGDPIIPSHYQIVQGFDEFAKEHGIKSKSVKIYTSSDHENTKLRIQNELLNRKNIAACFSISARTSVILGNALRETGLAGKVLAIGSDIFEESVQFLKSGVFTNLICKNPYMQTYLASKFLVEYLLRDIRPASDSIYVGSEIVFQSNVSMFENGLYRFMI
ncbi:MAG: substrate-binding domain-containing protein [Clostridiales bacterium]|jgi:LacI family transcriptional regulator|nr:substrate-binding domain-containing protein [Clostridiales bacterium]